MGLNITGGSTSGGTGGGGGGSTWSSPNYMDILNYALQGYTAYNNYSQGKKANETNVKLQRENQSWQEAMANTAVQRRARDIQAAGGNPAAAFVNGGEAATPNVTPARVEPAKFNAPVMNTAVAMSKAQIESIHANTINTTADTRMKTIQSDLLETFGGDDRAQDVVHKTQENQAFKFELDKKIADAKISEITAELLADQKEEAIRLLRSEAKIGELNAESAEAIARTLGVAAKDVGTVGKLFLEMVKLLGLGGLRR